MRRSGARPLAVVAILVTVWLGWTVIDAQLDRPWLLVGVHPDVVEAMERSLDDLRTVAALDPEREAEARARFEATERLLHRLQIVALHRRELVRRLGWSVLLVAGLVGAAGLAWGLRRERRHQLALVALGRQLDALASGGPAPRLWPERRDLLARISDLAASAGERMRRDRDRLRSLEHLAAWQEGARLLSHELRTPLASVRLTLDRLLAAGGDAGHPGFLERLDADLRRLGRDVEALGSMAGQPPLDLSSLDVGIFLTDFVGTFAAAWPSLELSLELDSSSGLVLADRAQLRQLLVNLCANVDDQAKRTARTLHVVLRSSREEAEVVVEVEDDGPGLAAAVIPRLFEPFNTSRREEGGTGLGLAVSRKIALEHGGDLEWAVPRHGSGCLFRLRIPVEEESA